jgi:hypothetical protein
MGLSPWQGKPWIGLRWDRDVSSFNGHSKKRGVNQQYGSARHAPCGARHSLGGRLVLLDLNKSIELPK